MRMTLLFLFSITYFYAFSQKDLSFRPLQKYAIFEVNYRAYTSTKFEEDTYPGDIKLSQLDASIQIPSFLKDGKTIINNSIDFSFLNPKISNSLTELNKGLNFFSIAYELGYIRSLGNRNWKLITTIKPTLSSDFKNSLVSEDFILQGAILFSKRKNKYFKYGFGLTYNTRFGNKIVLPIFQFVRKKNNWETDILLPAHLNQFYHFSKSKIGVSLEVIGNIYNYDYPSSLGYNLDKLSYTKINVGIKYELEFMENLAVSIAGGYSILNNLEFINTDGNTELNLSPVNDFFLNIGFKLQK